jgi:hypothetical protein
MTTCLALDRACYLAKPGHAAPFRTADVYDVRTKAKFSPEVHSGQTDTSGVASNHQERRSFCSPAYTMLP